MQRLFIPLLLSAFLLGCDGTTDPPDFLQGDWALESARTFEGTDLEAPLGSVMRLSASGDLAIESGNDCSGEYRVTGEPGEMLSLAFLSCTEAATTPETDLALLIHTLTYPDGDASLYSSRHVYPFGILESLPPYLSLEVGEVRLRFRQESR